MDVATMMDIFVSYGFESDDEMTDDRKLEALNETYWDACGRETWPFLVKTMALTFGGSSGVPTNDPADINQVMQVYRTADGVKLEPWRADDFYDEFASQLTRQQSPLLYFFEGDQLTVYPRPSASETVTVKYLQTPAELTELSVEADIAVPKRFHRSVLVVGTLSKLAVMQDDVDMGNAYERLYEKALAFMIGDVMQQQSDRTDFIHVNDPDNWDYS
jgi:hypothetical protein